MARLSSLLTVVDAGLARLSSQQGQKAETAQLTFQWRLLQESEIFSAEFSADGGNG